MACHTNLPPVIAAHKDLPLVSVARKNLLVAAHKKLPPVIAFLKSDAQRSVSPHRQGSFSFGFQKIHIQGRTVPHHRHTAQNAAVRMIAAQTIATEGSAAPSHAFSF